MRNYLAILAFLGVGVLSIFLMPRSAFAVSIPYKIMLGTVSIDAEGNFSDLSGNTKFNVSAGYGYNVGGNIPGGGFSSNFVLDVLQEMEDITCPGCGYEAYLLGGGNTVMEFGTSGVGQQANVIEFNNSGTPDGYLDFESFTRTRFISFTPSGGSLVATSSATTTGFSLYVSGDDWNDSFVTVFNLSYFPEVGPVESIFFNGQNNLDLRYGSEVLALPGPNTFSTTTDLSRPGKYLWTVKVQKDKGFLADLFIGGSDIVIASTSEFWVGTTSSPRLEGINAFQSRLESLMASSTYSVGASCSPLSTGFDFGNCLADILYPGVDALREDLTLIKQMPPWGYLFRVYDIFTENASSSLPSISATIPYGIIGAGSSINLDPNHALDFVLNASTSQFVNVSASSTETFFEITNRYWSYLVYIGLAFYILFRIIGLTKLKI